ncbi:SNF2 domain-containing protein CLASSY 2-like [Cornus florida]|uniref:SNF2 domain-containing protein CLASSY 2-like n=1 Tax=Cornus florida TaxID=4283 RepID=UPI00289BF4F9|nr:SNF2 domain-containing protein CLASSY 2-like [Cornus florida]XP_059666794.1 SNF2 domain-containing protein CLASSY 2-like [Cornus florida]XP_059666795.1 SNF2 domain-containing protein CLASSY 2-like [Cornus florida]XP_059666796.1 SNF2 domain-containing protein CLASSY 2-like [Cornus florida]
MKGRHLHNSTHPFDAFPFETFHYGSWKPVERLRIKDGAIAMHLVDNEVEIVENIPMSNLRIRSRKAILSDCTCFLRPGLDICTLVTPQHEENSGEEENLEPVWFDAKIKSIERKPHQSKCDCQFYVSFYASQGPPSMSKKSLSKEINMVQIDQISILQKLKHNPCENEHYRWNFSEDCSSLQTFKLFTGKFSSDLSWLVVASVLKQIVFDVRSIQNRIVYIICDDDHGKRPLKSGKHSNSINFKLEDGILIPILVPFVPVRSPEEGSDSDMHDVGPLSIYDLMDLRRSKRRYVQPERYLGCGDLSESDINVARTTGICKPLRWEYEEMPLALSIQADHAYYSGKHVDKDDSYESVSCQNKIRSREVKSVLADGREHESQLAIVPLPAENDLMVVHEEDPLDAEIPSNHSGAIGELFSKYQRIRDARAAYKEKHSEVKYLEIGDGWDGKKSHKKYPGKTYSSIRTQIESYDDSRTSRKRCFSAGMYRDLIRKCMKNIESTMNKEQPLIIDQWKEFQAANFLDHGNSNDMASTDNNEESSELEMLWKEMELSLASTYLLEDNEVSNVEVPAEDVEESSKHNGQVCRHEYKLNEEIGIVCQLCGSVNTEIRDVCPPFLQYPSWTKSREPQSKEDSEHNEEDANHDFISIPAASDMPLSEGNDNVWVLIPDLREKLRFHQKRAFEFLWRNIAGSMVPALMEPASRNRGGCVISHSPGAGKTLLIIAFLVSYLKLFPGSRPLVLAPKTTLYTWYKEIIKWEIPIPVYQIHGGRTYRGEILRQKLKLSPGVPGPNQDVMHILDCLEKIQKWLSQPSVLLMGYTSFLTLTREDSRFAHRKYMGQVLRECPGLLILDEGHNPRSTKSRLRKGLMKVDTGLRILLSGTLFQNNFGEYFNTLSLARPTFVSEVLMELDPKFRRRKKGAKTRFSLENRARKFFIDKIGSRINSNIPGERLQGLNILKNLTSGFIDVHEGGSSDNLPGLQIYTLMMKSTTIQQKILVKLQNQRPVYKGFPLELELLITLGSIHPWLIRTTECAKQYFGIEELESLEKYKFDLKIGSKVRFIMSLVPRCLIRNEKVLIFCHNIAPITLFLEIFEMFYGWRKGEEVLVLQGDLELFERGRVMDKFEEPGGASKVLLASITACAEGVSLTAASRVILLDSEWNPSKSKQAIARAFRPGQAKVVYVYQLLATGTLEEEKHSRTTWKEWVSSMIFSEELVEDPSHWQAEKIEDDILREIVEEDRATLFHSIMKNEKASNGVVRGTE